METIRENAFEMNEDAQRNPKQRSYTRILQLYYYNNISNLSVMLKKCIPDIDCHNQNRFIRKNDKVWVQANLNKVYQSASHRIEKSLLSKNIMSKNSIENYQNEFKSLLAQKKALIIKMSKQNKSKEFKVLKPNKRFVIKLVSKDKSFSVQKINSQPSCSDKKQIGINLLSKREFRVRQLRNNIDQMMYNTRYMQKLEKVKLQSTFTQLFFHKQSNPEEIKTLEIEKKYVNKLKLMTNIRCSFNQSQRFFKSTTPEQNLKLNNFLGIQTPQSSFYRAKSKFNSKNNKIFINF